MQSRLRPNEWGVPIRNFGCVVPGRIYRGARPDRRGYQALRSLGVETVVTLLEDAHPDDGLAARAADLRWYRIPLSATELPTFDRLQLWLTWTRTDSLLPIFIHCNDGIHRTSGLVAAYRIAVEGWSNQRAYEEALSYGFYPDRGHEAWDYFLRSVSLEELGVTEPMKP